LGLKFLLLSLEPRFFGAVVQLGEKYT